VADALAIERFVSDGTTPPAFEAVRGSPELPVEPLPAGVTCRTASVAGRPVARLTLWRREDLAGAPGLSGMIGHYEALARDAGVSLLEGACRELTRAGVARVLGPMNGSTWARYRLALPARPGDPVFEPPFFTAEPRNPFDYPEHFEAAGFRIAASYESRLDDLASDALDMEEVAARVARAGFSFRPLDLEHFGAELDVLFELSLEAFAQNPYYSPIEASAFRAMYEPLRARMDPEFVQLAMDRDGRPCGYLFAFSDPPAAASGTVARLIAKTVAVAPRARGQGLANHMLDRIRAAARRRGHREMIHALMHVANASTSMSSRHGGRLFRRYALWEWTP
jgi:GNAT superfamily N-acetyltransferase